MPKGSFDIVGDVHGTSHSVHHLVDRLGYRHGDAGWSHPAGRHLVFVGDLVDQGPDPLGCLEFVQQLQADGVASWVLGNHELNLLHLLGRQRPDTERARVQARTTLAQIEAEPDRFEQLRAFLMNAPLFLELDEGRLRVVHACWDLAALTRLPRCLAEDDALERTGPEGELSAEVETALKGTEEACDPFPDAYGNVRRHRRVQWWKRYPPDAPLVVFGHYRFPRDGTPGEPTLLGAGENAACVDYDAAGGGQLVALHYPERTFLSIPADPRDLPGP